MLVGSIPTLGTSVDVSRETLPERVDKMTTMTYWQIGEKQKREIESAENAELRAALVRKAELGWAVIHDNRRHWNYEMMLERDRRDFLGFLFSPWTWNRNVNK
jgi:hypothetical protein